MRKWKTSLWTTFNTSLTRNTKLWNISLQLSSHRQAMQDEKVIKIMTCLRLHIKGEKEESHYKQKIEIIGF